MRVVNHGHQEGKSEWRGKVLGVHAVIYSVFFYALFYLDFLDYFCAYEYFANMHVFVVYVCLLPLEVREATGVTECCEPPSKS